MPGWLLAWPDPHRGREERKEEERLKRVTLLTAAPRLLGVFPAIHPRQAGVSRRTQMLTAVTADTPKDIFSPCLFAALTLEWEVLLSF